MSKFMFILLFIFSCIDASASPVLNFSDLIAGPKTGNTDGVGSGAIVTIWGNNLGSSLGTSKIYVGDVEATAVYYWKDADGALPGGPSDLKTFHKMQEVCFSIPATAIDGANTIKVVVGGVTSNTIPFTVRSGNIYFIKSTGNDSTGNGSWSSPWLTLNNVLSGNGKIVAGDTVYSVGVGYAGQVVVGSSANIAGTASNQVAFATYPNTTVSITPGQWLTAVKNYSRGTPTTSSSYFSFSKLAIDTKYEAFSLFAYGRYIGNYITGALPSSSQSLQYSGVIGGNCTSTFDTSSCSGHKILGNEIENYGDITGTNNGHHLFYISNRSGSTAEAYEIGWTYAHENTAYQGIHVYDMSPGGGWTGTFKIHDNVIKNQAGNAINLNAAFSADYDIYNNITILDGSYAPTGGQYAQPNAGLRIDTIAGATIDVFNNTFYGYASANDVATAGTVSFRNNVVVDNRSIDYVTAASPETQSDNLFYSYSNPVLPVPSWATIGTGNLNENPDFIDADSYDFRPATGSPLIDVGYDTTATVNKDFFGLIRGSYTVDIGATEYVTPGGRYRIRIQK